MLAFSKFCIALVSPLGTCFLLAGIGLALFWLRRPRAGRACLCAGMAWLLLWSLPLPSFWLCSAIERRFAQRPAPDYATADAIVVLGGGMVGSRPGWIDRPQLGPAADRVWFAAQLFRAGRAPRVIVSAGSDASDGQVEADATAAFLEDLGVPASALLLDRRSRDTAQNASYSQAILREHRLAKVLLVTSALHMPRALAAFRKLGIEAVPAPADFSVSPSGPWPQRWLPNADALDASSRAIKEVVGLWGYRLRGKA